MKQKPGFSIPDVKVARRNPVSASWRRGLSRPPFAGNWPENKSSDPGEMVLPQRSPLALAPPGAFGALYERPGPWPLLHGPGLAARTPTSEMPMTDSAHSMNLRGARLGVSFTEGHEAVVSRASLS